MQLIRMFSTDKYKGKRNYLNTQKKYEIIRTCLYFAVSLSLFFAGYIATGNRLNLLTIVAVLGCLPASKSAVEAIMFLRYKSCEADEADQIQQHIGELDGLYDMVFTSYQKNYNIAHLVVKGNTICGFTQDSSMDENAFYKHLDGLLKMDNFRNTSIKVFKDANKYLQRLDQMQELSVEEDNTLGIIATLKSVSL